MIRDIEMEARMESKKIGVAGTLESCDIQIQIESNDTNENEIYLRSVVEAQFGDHIRALIRSILNEHQLKGVVVSAVDRGALDCTIIARTQTAILRYSGESEMDWSVILRD